MEIDLQYWIERRICNGLFYNMDGALRDFLKMWELRSLKESQAGLDAHLYGLDKIAERRRYEDILERGDEDSWSGGMGYWWKGYNYTHLLMKAIDEVRD